MKKSTITISALVILAIIAGGFWYTKNQKGTTKPVDVIKEVQEEISEDVISTEAGGSEESETISEDNQDIEELEIADIDTSNWKTYRNEELGFEVKYPEGWEVESMRFATIWPVPTPVNCKKTPEKCKYVGITVRDHRDIQNNTINYFNIKIVVSNEIHKEDGLYVDVIKGSEFAPGDMCFLSYIDTLSNKERILITTLQDRTECDENKHNKLFNLITNYLRVF